MAVEISLNFALQIVRFHIFIVLDKNKFLTNQSSMRQEVVLLFERFDGKHFFLGKVVVLKLLNLVFLVLHPQYSAAIEVKRHSDFGHPELPVQLNLVLIGIDFVHILIFHLQLDSCIAQCLQMAYLFCVGKAQNMTILTPNIIVIECEQTMFEWLRSTLNISSF